MLGYAILWRSKKRISLSLNVIKVSHRYCLWKSVNKSINILASVQLSLLQSCKHPISTDYVRSKIIMFKINTNQFIHKLLRHIGKHIRKPISTLCHDMVVIIIVSWKSFAKSPTQASQCITDLDSIHSVNYVATELCIVVIVTYMLLCVVWMYKKLDT